MTAAVSIPILDTHQHLIYADRLHYSVATTVPALTGRSFRYEDYVAATEGTGIASTLFMETTADPWREEFALVQEIAEQPGSLIRGIIAQCPPELATEFQPWLEAHLDHGLCAGIRRICHTEPDQFSLQPAFVSNVRLLGAYGLPFDLCFLGRQLPVAMKLARLCPGTQMILDHCGIPDIAGGEWESWKKSIFELAALPNVHCKISGLLAYCRPHEATLDTVRPYVEHCITCFGWERVVWGSDWPFCNQTTTVDHWVAVSRELVRGESEQNQHNLFRENARRLYRAWNRQYAGE